MQYLRYFFIFKVTVFFWSKIVHRVCITAYESLDLLYTTDSCLLISLRLLWQQFNQQPQQLDLFMNSVSHIHNPNHSKLNFN